MELIKRFYILVTLFLLVKCVTVITIKDSSNVEITGGDDTILDNNQKAAADNEINNHINDTTQIKDN